MSRTRRTPAAYTTPVTQLDLFGADLPAVAEPPRPTAARLLTADGLTCLRTSVPEALEIAVRLRSPSKVDTRAPRADDEWAFCASRRGLRFERATEWWTDARERGEVWGWDRTPAHLLPWTDLAAAIGDDPRRAELVAWVDSLPFPRWQITHRPHELWVNPGWWNPGYIEKDHADPRWPERLHAWQTLYALLDDAIKEITDHA